MIVTMADKLQTFRYSYFCSTQAAPLQLDKYNKLYVIKSHLCNISCHNLPDRHRWGRHGQEVLESDPLLGSGWFLSSDYDIFNDFQPCVITISLNTMINFYNFPLVWCMQPFDTIRVIHPSTSELSCYTLHWPCHRHQVWRCSVLCAA